MSQVSVFIREIMTNFSGHCMRLRDLGNSLIVVEHDEDTMRAADLRCGYRSRSRRTWWKTCRASVQQKTLMANPESITGAYLSGQMSDSGSKRAKEACWMAEDQRCCREQSEAGKCGYSSWGDDLCYRCQWFR